MSGAKMRRYMRKMSVMAATMLVLSGGMLASVTLAQAPTVNGQVTKIDETAGKITLKHGPIKKLEMNEGMTMVFRVRDPAMLKQVKVGDKVKLMPIASTGRSPSPRSKRPSDHDRAKWLRSIFCDYMPTIIAQSGRSFIWICSRVPTRGSRGLRFAAPGTASPAVGIAA